MPSSSRRSAPLLAGLAVLASATPGTTAASLGDVIVLVEGVRSTEGHVRVELCTQSAFLTSDCTPSLAVAAQAGETAVHFPDVPPGLYALQAYHDRNDDGRVTRGALGIPLEDVGFSRDAPLGLQGPKFARAAVRHETHDDTYVVHLRHFWPPHPRLPIH